MSIRGKMIHFMLRHRHLLKGRLRPEVIDFNTSIEKLRADTDAAAEKMARKRRDIVYKEAGYEGFFCEWVMPQEATGDMTVLYFHGGGFVMGNARSHRNLVGNFVKRLGIKALVFDYRLAPEHPAPAAVEDAVDVYSWLLKQNCKPEKIAFVGDSAGGGIALATLIKCRDEGLPMPAACAVFSPCTDMTMSGESHKTRAKVDPCTPEGANETFLGYYVGEGNPRNPYASPLYGELQGLPPIMIQVGDDETLRDDSVMFAEKAEADGVEIRLKVWKGMFHCFPLMAPLFPEATAALKETCDFLKKELGDS